VGCKSSIVAAWEFCHANITQYSSSCLSARSSAVTSPVTGLYSALPMDLFLLGVP
jgi:hypothetical protein